MRYDVDDWVQTDITKQSRLNYDYHWQHEIITKVNGNTNESKIELGDETITVTFRDLRPPHLVWSTHSTTESNL